MNVIRFEVGADGVIIMGAGGEMWCGTVHEWVHPESSHFQMIESCHPLLFRTLKAAARYAVDNEWMDAELL